jgi:hypothetical protein
VLPAVIAGLTDREPLPAATVAAPALVGTAKAAKSNITATTPNRRDE